MKGESPTEARGLRLALFLIVPIDPVLTEITNDLAANYYFGVVSSLVLIVVCAVLTERVVEPRLGEYRGEIAAESGKEVSPEAMAPALGLRSGAPGGNVRSAMTTTLTTSA